MVAVPITVSNLPAVGRTTVRAPDAPEIYVTYRADFSAPADVTLDFTIVNQQLTFGIVRGMFIDNSANPSEVVVSVAGTQMRFTVPANSEGYYKIDANAGSSIEFVTDGGATAPVTISLYNYEIPPNVWYRYGAFNKDQALKIEGTQPKGTDMDVPTADNNPVYIAGADAAGILRPVLTDNTGRVLVVGAAAGGVAFGPDAVGAAPTQPPILISGIDSAGHIKDLSFNAANEIPVHDNQLAAVIAAINAIAPSSNPAIGNQTNVAGVAADTIILASNANRKGATIFNDSTVILYLLLSNAVSTNALYTLQILSNGYYEVPFGYTGVIKGLWASATGSARVTELV